MIPVVAVRWNSGGTISNVAFSDPFWVPPWRATIFFVISLETSIMPCPWERNSERLYTPWKLVTSVLFTKADCTTFDDALLPADCLSHYLGYRNYFCLAWRIILIVEHEAQPSNDFSSDSW